MGTLLIIFPRCLYRMSLAALSVLSVDLRRDPKTLYKTPCDLSFKAVAPRLCYTPPLSLRLTDDVEAFNS